MQSFQDEPAPKKIKNIKLKRTYKKKSLPNTPTNSPVASSPRKRVRTRTPTSENRRSAAAANSAMAAGAIATVIVKEPDPEPKPEPKDDIENDVREIKKAIGEVEQKEKILDSSIELKDSDSPSLKEVNHVLTNGDVADDVKIDVIESTKSVKRKRVSLTQPESDNLDKSLTNSIKKRARSNSVHFSETVIYINDVDIVSSSDKKSLLISNDVSDVKLNGHLDSITTNGIEKDSVDFCKTKELNDKGKNLKVYRARTRKSLNNSVDEI